MPAVQQEQYKEVLERARKRYNEAVAAEQEMRTEALIDLEFLSGEQWDVKTRADRERGQRPCLVFNKVLPPVTQLGNQARQNKPAIKVSPVDSAGDVDTAKVIAGLIRHIEYDSDAEQAYDTALFYAAGCGFGYWRYGCEYLPKSFDQEIKTITVEDPFSIYLDCYARKPDRSDAKWGFVIDRMANDVHEARFGEDEADLSSDFVRELSDEGWRDEDSKRVAEYWEVDSEKKTLRVRVDEDGTHHPVYIEDMDPADVEAAEWATDEEGEILEREEEIPRVMQYVINGAAVLETPVKWDGSTIPIVRVAGLEMVVRGKRKIFSMTRFARDPQQLLNYYKTMEAETIALAPKPKYVGAVGQFKTKRRDWQRANTDNAAFLEYDLVEVNGHPVGEPKWRTFDPPVQALSIGAAAAIDDIKSSTGYYDPSLGVNKGDQSGVAINALQRQGDVSNFHFMDNLARAIKRGGRILLELIPKKYDTDREIRIVGEDQKQRILRVNAPSLDDSGKPIHHQLDLGRYDLRVEQGSSYESQRRETSDMLMALAKGNPQVWQLAADIFFENQDFIGAERLAQRFRAALPPAMQEAENSEVPPQAQAQIAAIKQELEKTQQENQQLTMLIKTKLLELESKERIATEGNRTKILTAAELSKSSSMNRLAELDHAAVQHQLDLRAELLHKGIDIHADAEAAMQAQQPQQPQQPQSQPGDAGQQGPQGPAGQVRMRAPDGTESVVPAEHAAHYQSRGAEVVQ